MTERDIYYDKVYGGWLGKCLGGAAGAPVEGVKQLLDCKDYKEVIRTDMPNDDLDLQLLWFEVMEEKGLSTTAEDLADAWNQNCWYPFNEYGYFLKNYERGILPPYSGSFNNSFFAESEGCPIRSEIWGMLFHGQPKLAAEFAKMDGSLDHVGNAIWIEQYYAAVEASAFCAENLETLLIQEKHYLPQGSEAARCLEDVLAWHHQYPEDWIRTRTLLIRKYAHCDFTNAVTNLGIGIIALLYGGIDLDKVINIAFRCGYDTDCTCATAGAIWGIVYGAEAIPVELKELVNDEFVAGIRIKRDNFSIRFLSEDTCRLAERLSEEAKEQKRLPEQIHVQIAYEKYPAIGLDDCCKIRVILKNETRKVAKDMLRITALPEGWEAVISEDKICLQSEEEKFVDVKICTTERVNRIENRNILQVEFAGIIKKFGIAGASEWLAVGPYMETLEKEDPPGTPSPHGEDCVLPNLECMVNNAVFLQREYLDESNLCHAFQTEDTCRIHGYEDLLPLDEVFSFHGQGCIYLKQELIAEREEIVWVVIGNNDGFRLWMNEELCLERDEVRLWTPYNNYIRIKLHKGKNQVILKLLRRTESLKFSIGFRKYEGEHFHKRRWCVDMASKR